jgi:hypothetical protein
MTAVALVDVGLAVLVWAAAVALLLAGMHAIPDDPRDDDPDVWREPTWQERRGR